MGRIWKGKIGIGGEVGKWWVKGGNGLGERIGQIGSRDRECPVLRAPAHEEPNVKSTLPASLD